MLEIFANWELWQISLTAVFGTVLIVFIILDKRRKIAAKKLRARRDHFSYEDFKELREHGLSYKQIKELMQCPDSFVARAPVNKDGSK